MKWHILGQLINFTAAVWFTRLGIEHVRDGNDLAAAFFAVLAVAFIVAAENENTEFHRDRKQTR